MSVLDDYSFKVENIIADIWGDDKKRLSIKEVKRLVEVYLRVNDIVKSN